MGQSDHSRFVRPYDGRSTYPIDDEVLAGVEEAVLRRRVQRLEACAAEHARHAVVAAAIEKHLAPKNPYGETEANAMRDVVFGQLADAGRALVPIDMRKHRTYRKHPFLTIPGSCVDRPPRYDGSSSYTTGGGFPGTSVLAPAGDPQDGNLGGAISMAVVGNANVFVSTGIFFFTQDHCGAMDVRCDFTSNGAEHWETIGGLIVLKGDVGLSIYGDTGAGWGVILDSSRSLFSDTQYVGFSGRTFSNQSDQVNGSVEIHQNSLYYIEGWSQLYVDVFGLLLFGSGAGGVNLATTLTNIHICV